MANLGAQNGWRKAQIDLAHSSNLSQRPKIWGFTEKKTRFWNFIIIKCLGPKRAYWGPGNGWRRAQTDPTHSSNFARRQNYGDSIFKIQRFRNFIIIKRLGPKWEVQGPGNGWRRARSDFCHESYLAARPKLRGYQVWKLKISKKFINRTFTPKSPKIWGPISPI